MISPFILSIPKVAVASLLLAASLLHADELRFAGVLGNSGGNEDGSLVTFSGDPASGIGPVLDAQNTLWERGGARQLNRYALDGRLLASFEIPESTDRSDQLVLAGDLLVLKLRKSLYSLPANAAQDTKPRQLPGQADVLSSSSHGDRLVIADKNVLFWIDPESGDRSELLKTDIPISALHPGPDKTVYAFGEGKVHAWKDGALLPGFPKGFYGERPQLLGRHWFSHSWHGTINRMNDAFEPDPGVVLGGASGSFIGYMPASGDLTNGRGIVQLRDDLFAVSGLGGVVQFLTWNAAESRFDVVRRIAALADLIALAIDAQGYIWTPRGSWRWTDSPEAPLTLGDTEPALCAQPVVLGGRTLCLLKKHYQYVQLARGPLIDENGLAHFETPPVKDFELPDSVSGAAAVPDGDRLQMIIADRTGSAFSFGISADGRQTSPPAPVTIPGIENCTSLAWFDGHLLAAASGAVIAFQPDGPRAWKASSRLIEPGGDVFIHSDGKRLAVSDPSRGAVHLFDSLSAKPATFEGLHSPARVAVSGNRVAVYEAGKQRLVKLELAASDPAPQRTAKPADLLKADPAALVETDFQNLGRPGGIPFSAALKPGKNGLHLAVQTAPSTPPAHLKIGIAGNGQAVILSGDQALKSGDRFDFLIPPGDWSQIRLAASVTLPEQQERFGFLDHRAIHTPFNDDPSSWAPFDLATYRESVAAREQEIRLTFEQPEEGKATLVIENAAGQRVRNLVSGRPFSAAAHTVVWDGLDDSGKLVAPGDYRWRGITHPGIEPVYKMNFANGGETSVDPWGPNHSTFHSATTNGDLTFFAAPVTEGGWALVALDPDGNWVQGYDHQHGLGIQHDAIAADAKYLYCAQDGFSWGGTKDIDLGSDSWSATWKLTVVRYDIATGKLTDFPDSTRALVVDEMAVGPGSAHQNLDEFNLGGIAVLDGKLYVASRNKNSVFVLDAESGEKLDSIPLPGPRHLAAGKEIFAATDRGIVRLADLNILVPAGDLDLSGIAVAPGGDIFVSDRASHQIHRFDAAGKSVAVIGAPGGPYAGPYDPNRLVEPRGISFDRDGKLWITENRENPKRLLAWDLATNKVVYEKFGMPRYGGDGSGFDPENPRRWIGLGCFWDVDIDSGSAHPTHVLSLVGGHFGNYAPHSYSFFREAGRTFVSTRGKIALISEVLENGTLRDIAATAGTHHFSYACDWDPPQSYIDAFYKKWPDKRGQEKPGRKGEGKPWSQRGMGVLWVDRNGDGQPQVDEFDFCGDQIDFAGGAWGHQQHSLTLSIPVADKSQVKIAHLKPDGFLPNGTPKYPTLDEAIASATPVSLTPGYKRSGVATVRDRDGRFIFNSDPELNAYAPDGRHLWSYPNRWSDVHGSHDAPLPEPGVMQGTLGILGLAPFDSNSDVFFLNGNHGRCFLLTSDGLYLDEAFDDVRVSYLKNEYRLGGEIFGGSFGRVGPSGKFYVQIGHGPYRIYELTGLDKAKRISGSLAVNAAQIAAAERQNLRRVAATQPAKVASIPGQISWDKSGKFRVALHISADSSHLNLRYQVEDPSPWVNSGRDWTQLFATGDSVDLQFGGNPEADPKRRDPAPGDFRLLIAPFEGKPIAVLYEHRKPGGKNPIEFTSPWRGAKVDDVRQLPNAKIDVSQDGGSYSVTASIPLPDLGLTLKPGTTYRADFGVTYGDAGGSDTNLRSYWSNQSTALVDDIPGEIMLSPNLWGELLFTGDKPE